jgi:hypothetical protein
MPNLAVVLGDLSTSLAFANAIIASAHITDTAGAFVQPLDVRSFLTEAAVVRTHIAWERFLEQSFLSYLVGETSISGARIVRYLDPPSFDHANRVLIGTQRYVDWGNPEIVVKLAGLYFPLGTPYKVAIEGVQSDLSDLRAVRNAAAHLSTSTSTQLDRVALRRVKKAVVGITVYDLVTASDSGAPGKTILQSFMEILIAAATVIAT